MTSVSLNVGVGNGLIILTVTHDAAVNGIDRADLNGTRALRTIGIFPQAGSGSFAVTDYEASLTGLVEYRVHTATGVVVARATIGIPGVAQRPRFGLPFVPQQRATVDTVLAYEETRETSSTFHQVIGRKDPLVILGGLRPRTGRLKIFCDTYAESREVLAVMQRGTTVFYRQAEHAGLDLYFIPTRYAASADADSKTWEVEVEYTEVDYPLGDIRPVSGWTFNALKAEESSFNAVSKKYNTFENLTIGERNS